MTMPVNPASRGQGPQYPERSDVHTLTKQMDALLTSGGYHEMYYEDGSTTGANELITSLTSMKATLEGGFFPSEYDTSHALDLVNQTLTHVRHFSSLLEQGVNPLSTDFQEAKKECITGLDDLAKYV